MTQEIRGSGGSSGVATGVEEERAGVGDTARKAGAERVIRDAQDSVREKARELKDTATERADRWTTAIGQQVECLTRAMRAAGDSLEGDGERRMAAWSRQAADQVERAASYLEEEDPRSMLEDLEQLARSNPTAFVSTTFAAGLILGRFLRSSAPTAADGDGQYGEGSLDSAAGGASGTAREETLPAIGLEETLPKRMPEIVPGGTARYTTPWPPTQYPGGKPLGGGTISGGSGAGARRPGEEDR